MGSSSVPGSLWRVRLASSGRDHEADPGLRGPHQTWAGHCAFGQNQQQHGKCVCTLFWPEISNSVIGITVIYVRSWPELAAAWSVYWQCVNWCCLRFWPEISNSMIGILIICLRFWPELAAAWSVYWLSVNGHFLRFWPELAAAQSVYLQSVNRPCLTFWPICQLQVNLYF